MRADPAGIRAGDTEQAKRDQKEKKDKRSNDEKRQYSHRRQKCLKARWRICTRDGGDGERVRGERVGDGFANQAKLLHKH